MVPRVILALAAMWVLPAVALAGVQVDEHGNGIDQNGNALLSQFMGDPFIIYGVDGTVLVYSLPYEPVLGDVIMLDVNPNPPHEPYISDVIRFLPAGGAINLMIFYSHDPFDLEGDYDSGLPRLILSPNVTLQEQHIGNFEWCDYTAGPGLPGYSGALGADQTYKFISSVPEPSSIALLGLGGLTLLRRRRSGAVKCDIHVTSTFF